MIKSENVAINGKEYLRTYSTDGVILRCGRKRYAEAVDPAGTEKAYFEEGIENEEEQQAD